MTKQLPKQLPKCLTIAAILLPLLAAVGPAAAQMPGQGFGQPPAQEPPPCIKGFVALRGEAEKRALQLRAASERKASPKELCGHFNTFVSAEEKVVKYAIDNNVWCGIPPQAIEQMKSNHEKSRATRTRVCQVAAHPPRPTGPTLGDALGTTPVPDASNVKRGRGTFDTLTGSPLGSGAR